MKRKYVMRLNQESINRTIERINEYKNLTLPNKTQRFLNELAKVGIEMIVNIKETENDKSAHHFFDMVTFRKHTKNGVIYIRGYNDNISGLHTHWYDAQGNPHDETISPILALEFGTAGLAIEGHQGTFAVTGNHVNDTEWYYYEELDENGKPTKKHKATAIEPKQPMYRAAEEMRKQIREVANKVFG